MPPRLLTLILMLTIVMLSNTESCAPIPPPTTLPLPFLLLLLLLLLLLPRLDPLLPVSARGEARRRMAAARKKALLQECGWPRATDLAGACGRGSL